MEIKVSDLKLTGREAEQIYRNVEQASDEQLAAASVKFDKLQKDASVRRDTCQDALEERVAMAQQLSLFEVDGNNALYADEDGNVVAVDETHFDANYKTLVRFGRGALKISWDDPALAKYFNVSISVNKDNLVADLKAGSVPTVLTSLIRTSVQPKLFITKSSSIKKKEED